MIVNITIDGRPLQIESGITILQAARQHGIFIPTLCEHKDLSPFAGCRLCIVEIEGSRKFPTACTMPVQEGQVIWTDSPAVRELRSNTLKLILSEHPVSCLLCGERSNCVECMGSIRKAGMTTGCGSCPKDGQCELQDLVHRLGLQDFNFPVKYRMYPVEKSDPFFDRDYNLCILCGRCVQICEKLHFSSAIAFRCRGSETTIGPAYQRTHLESGCSFCGACVTLCPTGSLTEKVRKWEGKPEKEAPSTCAFCSLGCQLNLLVKNNHIIGALPANDSLINQNQLCVKGRFGIPELVNHYTRLKTPAQTEGHVSKEISWDEAIQLAAEKLSHCPAEQFLMVVSPNCSNEDLYIAQKFSRLVMGSHAIRSGARDYYADAFQAYIDLYQHAISLDKLAQASVILCVGLDTQYEGAVIETALKRSKENGARLATIHPRHHSLSIPADIWLKAAPGEEPVLFRTLAELTSSHPGRSIARLPHLQPPISTYVENLADWLRSKKPTAIVVGTEFIHVPEAAEILAAIRQIALNIDAGIIALAPQNNLLGSILMGAYEEYLPGGLSTQEKSHLAQLGAYWRNQLPEYRPADVGADMVFPQVLYLIGEIDPWLGHKAEYVIYQNLVQIPDNLPANLALPTLAFTEREGTWVNCEGRVQSFNQAVKPDSSALPDWQILCRIAQAMGKSGFEFNSIQDIQEEICGLVPGFNPGDRQMRIHINLPLGAPQQRLQKKVASHPPDNQARFILSFAQSDHQYYGFPLSNWVEGLRSLFPEDVLWISPQDAHDLHVQSGDCVAVKANGYEDKFPVKIMAEQPPGTLRVMLATHKLNGEVEQHVNVRKEDV